MKPKSLSIATDIDADLVPKVQRAEQMLERILGRAAERVEVSWKRGRLTEPTDRSVLLTITDSGVTREYDFIEFELGEDIHVRRKLHDLWDDVLVERIERQRQRVLASLDEAEGE